MVYIYDQSEATRRGAQLDEEVYHQGEVRYILTDKPQVFDVPVREEQNYKQTFNTHRISQLNLN